MDSNDDKTVHVPVAAQGLLDRRLFLKGGLAGSLGLTFSSITQADEAEGRKPWMQSPGRGMSEYGAPSSYEGHVVREGIAGQQGTVGSGASRTPLQALQGTITPSGLHFERHHAGIPDINPEQHALVIHGLVERPLRFSMADLLRYPLHTRTYFLECSGNGAVNLASQPGAFTCARIHGLVSASEWTGIAVSDLLAEVGVKPQARWAVAEGADAARMNRSVPLSKMLDDAMLALYQNGERLRPAQGYPLRLFLPGFEGNASVKWLHRLELSELPAMSREETSKYTDLREDGRSEMFTFEMGIKSVITSPSGRQQLNGKGLYEISGLAWTGAGKVQEVEVSADGGVSWAPALLEPPVLAKSLTRFRIPWRWDGQPCTLISRAKDATQVQPDRQTHIDKAGNQSFYHYNAMQAWRVDANGQVHNTYV